MTTTAFASALAALGARERACVAKPAVKTAVSTWYVPAMGANDFSHKHPARRPPSLT
jgi:hypothetical protein